jgi:hypothetical protein
MTDKNLIANKIRKAVLDECARLEADDYGNVTTPGAIALRDAVNSLGNDSLLRLAEIMRREEG